MLRPARKCTLIVLLNSRLKVILNGLTNHEVRFFLKQKIVKQIHKASLSLLHLLQRSEIGQNSSNLSKNKLHFKTDCNHTTFGFKMPILKHCWNMFSSHSRVFHSFVDVTIAGEGLRILIYALQLWALSSEGSLACPAVQGVSVYNGHIRGLWHSHLMPSVWQWSYHHLFKRPRFVAAWIHTPNLPLAERTL